MKTSKPFSTIGYQTKEHLETRFCELILDGDIDFYAMIEHLPEDDEKKKHWHILIYPSYQIDTNSLKSKLDQIDVNKPDKKLSIMPCQKCNSFADWYLYAVHDTDYLDAKGLKRKYHYKQTDFLTSDDDFFNEQVHTINFGKFSKMKSIKKAILDGMTFGELVSSGQVPVQQMAGYKIAYQAILEDIIRTKEITGDPNTGEVTVVRNADTKHE